MGEDSTKALPNVIRIDDKRIQAINPKQTGERSFTLSVVALAAKTPSRCGHGTLQRTHRCATVVPESTAAQKFSDRSRWLDMQPAT